MAWVVLGFGGGITTTSGFAALTAGWARSGATTVDSPGSRMTGRSSPDDGARIDPAPAPVSAIAVAVSAAVAVSDVAPTDDSDTEAGSVTGRNTVSGIGVGASASSPLARLAAIEKAPAAMSAAAVVSLERGARICDRGRWRSHRYGPVRWVADARS